MKLLVAIITAVVALAVAAGARGFYLEPSLDVWASTVAQRPVTVRCYDKAEADSPWGYGAWGYVLVPLATHDWTAVDSRLCAGALAVNDDTLPEWQRALGVGVLTHEAYHLRRWGGAGDEGKVECNAIRHWKVAARALGASEATIADIWPTAVALHYRLTEYEVYNPLTGETEHPYFEPGCKVPRVIPPEDVE